MNWSLGETPSKCAVLKSCMRSPACMAPASAIAPATRLLTRLPGATPANASCRSLAIALTGFRSVSPNARTASTDTGAPNTTATSGS